MPTSTEPWDLDTRQLKALTAIARTRSISRAAEELGYGQSAVSQQLAGLERVIGHRLVDRGSGPRPVTLTPAGESVLNHASWVLDRLDVARRELDRLATGDSGHIGIGTFQSAGARLLPGVLAAYHAAWPALTIAIHNETTDGELLGLVQSGAIDVAFVAHATFGPAFDHVELLIDRYVALVPPTHRLASRTSVSLGEFDGEDMIDGSIGDICTNTGVDALRAAGAETNVVFRTDDNQTRQRLVDAGLGCAILPGLTVERGLPNGGVAIPITDELARVVYLAWSADRTPSFAVERFVETTQKVIAEMEASGATAPPKKRSVRR
jgi:DNA-binding transcriptional LysR family regulator